MREKQARKTTRRAAGDERAKKLLAWYDLQPSRVALARRAGRKARPLCGVAVGNHAATDHGRGRGAIITANSWRAGPSVTALAAAPAEEVMQAWAGLGYYSRARNLHACAQKIVALHGGRFPSSEAELRALPGIGPYTAAAVAAIAFGRRAIVIDGNIERVALAAAGAGDAAACGQKVAIAALVGDIDAAKTRRRFRPGRYGPWRDPLHAAQSRLRCVPACKPIARRTPGKSRSPIRASRSKNRARSGAARLITCAGPTARCLRAQGRRAACSAAWWNSAAATGAPTGPRTGPRAMRTKPRPCRGVAWSLAGEINHVFTHFALNLTVFVGAAPAGAEAPEGCRWLDETQMRIAALPSVMRKAEACARAYIEFGLVWRADRFMIRHAVTAAHRGGHG